ncbi:MAG: hypothetical protein NZT92_10910, partial [Abditibacteriales bacterium]|nr:hypothetical protein [Abditibacteriales bacterium]MDW8366448.1 hypothetical protein [Abditibacteriales bacterium]
ERQDAPNQFGMPVLVIFLVVWRRQVAMGEPSENIAAADSTSQTSPFDRSISISYNPNHATHGEGR